MTDIVLNTSEKYTLIGAMSDKLRWLYSVGGTRADHLQVAKRLVEICESLPDDFDGA